MEVMNLSHATGFHVNSVFFSADFGTKLSCRSQSLNGIIHRDISIISVSRYSNKRSLKTAYMKELRTDDDLKNKAKNYGVTGGSKWKNVETRYVPKYSVIDGKQDLLFKNSVNTLITLKRCDAHESQKATFPLLLTILGVVHSDRNSARFVSKSIKNIMPNVVVLELCPERSFTITDSVNKSTASQRINSESKWKSRISRRFQKILSQNLSPIEMKSAYKTAKRYGIRIVLGDRRISTTWNRLWSTRSKNSSKDNSEMSLVERLLLFIVLVSFAIVFSTFPMCMIRKVIDNMRAEFIQNRSEKLNSDAFNEVLVRWFPVFQSVVWEERERCMVNAIRDSDSVKECEHVLAVIGISHVSRLVQMLENAESFDLHELLKHIEN